MLRRLVAYSYNKGLSAVGFVVKDAARTLESSAPSVTSGSGAPSASEPNGSVYLRTSGLAYVRALSAWGVSNVMHTIADPGNAQAIPVTHSGIVNIVTAGAETNTLAIPTFLGQKLILNMDTRVGGDRVVTCAQRIDQAGNTVMTFGAAGDCIVLESVTIAGALRWQVTANDGVALS